MARAMPRGEALHWFREGFRAGVQAERGRLHDQETARRQRALERDLQQVIGILAVALLDDKHRRASAAASAREARSRQRAS